jgi:hypothetical protein
MCRRSLSLIASNHISLVCTAVMGICSVLQINVLESAGESQPDFFTMKPSQVPGEPAEHITPRFQ